MNINFPVAKFEFQLTPQEPLILPSYKGSTLRGGFGNAFKRVVCALKKSDCAECILKEKCVYSYIFETPPPSDTKIMRKYISAPHPFIIEPPPEKKRGYTPKDEIKFGLTLIGRAVDYLPYFIYTFDELGKIGIGKGRGKYKLKTVKSVKMQDASDKAVKGDSEKMSDSDAVIPVELVPAGSKQGAGIQTIYDSESKTLKSFDVDALLISFSGIASSLTSHHSTLSLSFLTPTRIVYDSHLTIDLEFHVLIRQLLRRISLLSYFHCGLDISDWDFKGIIEKSKEVIVKQRNLRWYDWERYSARQDTRMKMGGIL
ncbi:MAG: CRISPR-associated protein Cas6 [Thermodesulfovibrionia bacterium]|nr:CRISPR-associated protein Cas6 [Thermodesulfovibrionia bacterium]